MGWTGITKPCRSPNRVSLLHKGGNPFYDAAGAETLSRTSGPSSATQLPILAALHAGFPTLFAVHYTPFVRKCKEVFNDARRIIRIQQVPWPTRFGFAAETERFLMTHGGLYESSKCPDPPGSVLRQRPRGFYDARKIVRILQVPWPTRFGFAAGTGTVQDRKRGCPKMIFRNHLRQPRCTAMEFTCCSPFPSAHPYG